ncbi:hypothetical protein PInf_002321 [Phytophthora infestans]|nr:hypothetical protein PInf_002321 [Phytophthora infestans]
MQIAFRRKMLSIFALQLMLLTALVASLTYNSTLSEWTRSTFKRTTDLVGPLIGSIAALGGVYFVRTRFPLNWVMVAAFSVVLSLLVAGVQTWLDTPAGLFCCGFTFVTVCVMIVLSSLSYRYHGDAIPSGPSAGLQPDTDGEVVLRSSLVSGCIAFAISAIISGILYGILGDSDDFVSLRALGYSLALELVLIVWFSYDASSMYSIMTPDEYMSGVVYFYVDLIVLTCAAFFLAGIIRARQEEENNDAGVIPYDVDEDRTISYAGEEEVEPVPEVSTNKQMQIIGRVRSIADVLRDSLLLQDALRVITDHFALNAVNKSVDRDVEGVDTEEATDYSPTLVGYGLGSFCASSSAVHQLGFLVALTEALGGRQSEANLHCAEIFDPAMNQSDGAIAEHFQLKVIQENEHGRRRVASNTVFFMPHCGIALYQNVLACNWGPAIKKLVIIGNSFSAYGDRLIGAKERGEVLLVSVLPYLDEVPLPCGVAKRHDDFSRYEAAFNDLSILRFQPTVLDRALRDDQLLNEKMATVAMTETGKRGPTVPREIPLGRMKVRQILGWTRPTDMAMSSYHSKRPGISSSSSNNREHEHDVSYEAMNNLSTNKLHAPKSAAATSSPTAPPPPKVTFRKGEKSFLDFHQHYAITRHLGEGSYSTVKQVTHRKKGGFYACKIVDKLSLSDVDRAALSHEVRVLSSVSHVNIMRLYEVIEDDAKCYLVTELAEGGDLFDRIVKQGKFPEREAQKVAAALVEALHYCHKHSIIHRDVKPENVLLSGDDVKLCDFGFARQLDHQEDQASDSCGTPGYAAPEILDGRSYGLEVDVFSLGVVTYIMLCGYPPFPMKLAQLRTHRFNVRFPSKDWAAIHPDVKTLISKMLHVNPKERPSMAVLRTHPWIQLGRVTLERLRKENEERRRLADLTRRQHAASAIRKKLVMGGFEAVKYGRNGLPHRTKLRLSTDGKVMSWQPKLLKRSLLRYQNARSFTSIFGIGGKENSQPDLHAPQSEPKRIPTGGTPNNAHDESEHTANAACVSSPHPTDSSTSSTSDAINEKRLWWRSLRRERGAKTERTASGGFTLNLSARQTGSTPTSPITPPAAKVLRMRTPSSISEQPETPSALSPERLDDSIKLHDIRQLLAGDDAPFFAGHAMNLPNSSKRAVDPACVLSVCTRFRELHLEFPNEGIRDGFIYLLQQATLPLQQRGPVQSTRVVKASSMPPPAPTNVSDRKQDTFVATTPPDEEAKIQPDDREHSSEPEVDEEDVEAVAKTAKAVNSNQDE